MTPTERSRTRRWTRLEYERLIEKGFLDEDEPIELLDGLLLVKEPQSSSHGAAVTLVAEALRVAFGDGRSPLTTGPSLNRTSPSSPVRRAITSTRIRGGPRWSSRSRCPDSAEPAGERPGRTRATGSTTTGS